jgi:hypothetical protein
MYASSGLLMRLTSRMRSTEPWGAQCLNLITAGVAGFPAQELRECILVAREARRSSKGRKRVIVSCIILGLGYRCATSFEHRPSLPLESTPLSRNSAWYRSVQFVYATVQTGDFLAPNSSPVPLPFSKRGTFVLQILVANLEKVVAGDWISIRGRWGRICFLNWFRRPFLKPL